MKAKAIGEAESKTVLEAEREAAMGVTEDGGPPPHLEPVVTTTTRTYARAGKDLSQEDQTETLAVHDFLVPPARVGVELGQTINMGNYESVRIAVTCQVPCYREEMPEAYDHVVAFVKNRIAAEREVLVAWGKKKGAENLF